MTFQLMGRQRGETTQLLETFEAPAWPRASKLIEDLRWMKYKRSEGWFIWAVLV